MKIDTDEQLAEHFYAELRSYRIDWLAEYKTWRDKKRIPDAERFIASHVGDFVGYQLLGDQYETMKWKPNARNASPAIS